MITVTINPRTLFANPRYLRSKDNRLCLVGQVIAQSSPSTIIPTPTRTPCELKSPVSPITITFRNQIILTPTGYELLQITRQDPEVQFELANKLLNPHGIEVVPSSTSKPAPSPTEETFGIDTTTAPKPSPEELAESAYYKLNHASTQYGNEDIPF